MSGREAAALLPGVTYQTLLRWAKAGDVPCVRYPSGRFYFRRSDIEALVTPVVIGVKSEVEESGRPFEDVPLPGLVAAV